VPADYPTIQAGLDAAAFGDTVLVAPGTYTDYESRTFGSQTLTACAFLVDGVVLRSEQGPSVTTIDMQGQGSGVAAVVIGLYLASGQTVLEGFTVTGAPPVGTGSGAALVGGATTTVRDCIFRDLASGADTGGIFANNASLVVVGCEFENCVGGIAGGIWQDNAEITVTGSSFRNCSNHAIRLNGETAGYPETAVISDCEFIENSSTYDGGAVYVDSYSGGVQITGCRFERNLATGGSGGAVLVGNGTAEQYTIENCTFLFNRLESDLLGGAVFLYANTTVRGNTFYGNSQMSPLAGGQTIAIHTPSSIENNIIAGTSGTAAVWAYPGTDVAMHCNVFWENLGGNVEWLEMGPTDREVNPLFCDVPSEDFRLMKGSPCLPPGSKGCGLIGALGQGCDVISVMPRSWGAIKSAYR
jgi:predicted outer membrane repeat protein